MAMAGRLVRKLCILQAVDFHNFRQSAIALATAEAFLKWFDPPSPEPLWRAGWFDWPSLGWLEQANKTSMQTA